MTTAARPTWAPAKGGNEQGGTRIFAPPRSTHPDTLEEVQKRNLREELEERERRHFSSKDKGYADDRDRRKSGQLLLEGVKREAEDRLIPRSVDADDSDIEAKSDDESDEDDDEDDAEALMAELEQIRRERAEDKLRKERLRQEEELKAKEAELIRGNPLLNNAASFSVKRRFCSLSLSLSLSLSCPGEAKAPKRFINDTIRNDFHRKFLHKYMK
ncbi:unnamed protein product [Spirodela intermedia]|uniref:Uncharacterized protein n=1 Tax=Spirodela intermedia TaxID=51605 RepID=A0A7I8ILT8_SPIIN|nr:unnamed protein product [Spirodela intermedia]CAA6658386.1 unnamed protein product [Spirodela intermedia]